MQILKEGDRGQALAEGRGRVEVVYRYRTLTLDSGVRVEDVLLGVDPATDEVVTIPAQSTPKIRQARGATKESTLPVRIPGELDDIVWLVSHEVEANPSKFGPAAVRYYLEEAVRNDGLARRLGTLSRGRLATAKARKKLTLRTDRELVQKVDAMSKCVGVTRSDLVRGAVVALKEDVLEGRAPRRAERLRAVARAL